jgi:deoxyribose-phosphate aldolase
MNIANYIDHTVLKPVTTETDVAQLCEEAKTHRFAAVCVPPFYSSYAKKNLEGTSVKLATVIGFPFGYSDTASKLAEIETALKDGADELDMVINLAALKNGSWEVVEKEVAASAAKIHAEKKVMKLIVESGLLTDEELLKCCKIVEQNQVDFIKTSTGYAAVGATVHAVSIMRKNLPATIRIKASGGIRTFEFAKELIAAGADRLGCSASVQIMEEQKRQNN